MGKRDSGRLNLHDFVFAVASDAYSLVTIVGSGRECI